MLNFVVCVSEDCPGFIQKSFLAIHRITESQNGSGWKGPLWVI